MGLRLTSLGRMAVRPRPNSEPQERSPAPGREPKRQRRRKEVGWWKLGQGSSTLLVAKGPCTPPRDGGLRGEPREPGGWGGGWLRKDDSSSGPEGSTAICTGQQPCLGGQCRFGAGDPPRATCSWPEHPCSGAISQTRRARCLPDPGVHV